jgi:hypothetical protein
LSFIRKVSLVHYVSFWPQKPTHSIIFWIQKLKHFAVSFSRNHWNGGHYFFSIFFLIIIIHSPNVTFLSEWVIKISWFQPTRIWDPPFPCTMQVLGGKMGILKSCPMIPKLWIWLLSRHMHTAQKNSTCVDRETSRQEMHPQMGSEDPQSAQVESSNMN